MRHLQFLNLLQWTIHSLGYNFGTLTQSLTNPKGHTVHLILELENPLIQTRLLEHVKLLGLPLTLFIKTEILRHDSENEESRLYTYKTIETLKKYLAIGWEIGTMGESIVDLTNLNHTQQLSTLSESTDSFTKTIGKPPKVFLYPLGAYDASTVSCLKQLKFIGGITSIEGVNQGHNAESFHLKRIYSKSLARDILSLMKYRLLLAQKTKALTAPRGAPITKNLPRTHLNFWMTDI